MKAQYLLIIVIFLFLNDNLNSQNNLKLDDFGRIVLNVYLPKQIDVPIDATKLLDSKLRQIASNYGMGGCSSNPRFILTASINIGTKDIISGPPQMIAQNLAITLFVGDAIENKIYNNLSISLKGVGTNDTKAFIDALSNINPNSTAIEEFVENSKEKIIAYYNTQCDFILKEAENLRQRGKFDEAIYNLALVPEICQSCYFKSLDESLIIYREKNDFECNSTLLEAKLIWSSNPNSESAFEITSLVSKILPGSSCQEELDSLLIVIESVIKEEQAQKWEFFLKQYEDELAYQKELLRIQDDKSKIDDEYRVNEAIRKDELEKLRIEAYREVAIEFAKNQPDYNYNIQW